MKVAYSRKMVEGEPETPPRVEKQGDQQRYMVEELA